MNLEELQTYAEEMYSDLLELLRTPGPSRCCARIRNHFPNLKEDLPMTTKIKEIKERFEESDGIDIKLLEDHGNIVLVGGLGSKNSTPDEIKKIPLTLGAHIDEITYLVSNQLEGDLRVLIPLCSPPTRVFPPKYNPFEHKEARILGVREGRLKTIGYGSFHAEQKIKTKRDGGVAMEDWNYLLKVEKVVNGEDVNPGDVAIQNYMQFKKYNGLNSVIASKALDDRVGTVVILYALRFLCQHMPIKAILSGDEEGVPRDVSWARLILPTYRRFCQQDVITILCDGINGADLSEFSQDQNKFLSDALLLPYTARGKGGGDYRLFSLMREKIIPICDKNDFSVRITTDYASRSFDPKIMNEYPLITFLDWSNGLVGNKFYRCHFHEEVLFLQVVNLVGCFFWTARYLSEKRIHLSL